MISPYSLPGPQQFDLRSVRQSIIDGRTAGLWFCIGFALVLTPLVTLLGWLAATSTTFPISERLSTIGLSIGIGLLVGNYLILGIVRNLGYVPESISVDSAGFTFTYPHGKTARYSWTYRWGIELVIQTSMDSESGQVDQTITLRPPYGGRSGLTCPPAGLTPAAAQAILETARREGLQIDARSIPADGRVIYSIQR